MAVSILREIGATPARVVALGKGETRAVVDLLLRWEAWEDALAVLDTAGRDEMVSVLDARARALVGLGRAAEAVPLLEERIEKKGSALGFALFARTLAASGDPARAAALLEAELREATSAFWFFGPLADIALSAGDPNRAEQYAYLLHQSSPASRHPDLILAQAALLRGDRIGASAYATRAATHDGDSEPTPEQLRTLRTLFASIPDEVRLADTEEQLALLRAGELDELRARFEAAATAPAEETKAKPARAAREKRRDLAPAPRSPSEIDRPIVTNPNDIPVSSEEHAALLGAAQRLFGFRSLRAYQPQILAASLRGEDLLAILPTGGGKSLTYQLPAFLAAEQAVAHGLRIPLTLVISPLIALMQDQVQGLPNALRAQTIALNSTLEGGQLGAALEALDAGEYALVYVAPERLRQRSFVEAMRRRGVARLVIDEAHCVSSWGHNFRPDYLHIAQAHADMGAPPILALTATAPTRVRQDIEEQLFANVRVRDGRAQRGRTLRLIAADSYRENLLLAAEQASNADERRARTIELCAQLPKPGLIYARSRKACEEIADELRRAGINADYYHAGLLGPERTRVQDDFLANRMDVLVATVAFGMGVDKPDIRFILHHGLPSSIEAYYQEAGRAGRDGKPSICVLLYTAADRTTAKQLARKDQLTVEYLRALYAKARALMKGRNPGAFALDELVRAAGDRAGGENDTRVRVALSALEEAGLVRHHYDAPETLALRLKPGGDAHFRTFALASGLATGQWHTSLPFADFCYAVGLDLETAEAHLQQWRDRGLLDMGTQGRRTLLTLVNPPPPNGAERVQGVVERLGAVLEQHVEDMYAYARTKRCRHGHLAQALGGAARKKCNSCDNCGAVRLPESQVKPPDPAEIEDLILQAVGKRSIGKKRLARLLRGDSDAYDTDKRSPHYGTVKLVTEGKLVALIEQLVAAQMLVEEDLESGAVVVKIGPHAARRVKELDSRW